MQKSIVLQKEFITPVNSTTYADVAGLHAGLDRFPQETSHQFLERVQQAVSLNQSSNYEGLLNQLSMRFGLPPAELVEVSDSTGLFTFEASIRGVTLTNKVETLSIPTRVVDSDDFWQWRRIADIVAAINQSRTFRAELLQDAPAVQIVTQNNQRQVKNQPVSGTNYVFEHPMVDENSVLFSVSVPNYVFSEKTKGILFDTPVRDSTLISYRYGVSPYRVIGYRVAVLSLSDPNLGAVAVSSAGRMIYQVREYLYQVAKQDRSYWGN